MSDEKPPLPGTPHHLPRKYQKKHPDTNSKGGRPEYWTEERRIEMGNKLLEWMDAHPHNVYFNAFAADHNVLPQMMLEWTRKSPVFNSIYKKAKEKQASKLIELGLKGGNNQAAVIFFAKNLAGMADKVETKSENRNYNIDHAQLKQATEDDLQEIIRQAASAKSADTD